MTMDLFSSRYIMINLELRIKALEPLSIGAGKPEVLPGIADQPIVKDPVTGLPVIPGSSLKGLVRATIYRILHPILSDKTEYFINFLFGSIKHASHIYFQEATLISNTGNVKPGLRHHIKINRLTGGVEYGPFSREFVPAGTEFVANISMINLPPSTIYIYYILNTLSKLGLVKMGGAKSRGYGKVEIAPISARLSYIIHSKNGEITLPAGFVVRITKKEKTLIIAEKIDPQTDYQEYEFIVKESSSDGFYDHVEIPGILDGLEKNKNVLSRLLVKFAEKAAEIEAGPEHE